MTAVSVWRTQGGAFKVLQGLQKFRSTKVVAL